MTPDLTGARAEIMAGRETAGALLERSVAAAKSLACRHAFLQTDFEGGAAAATRVDDRKRAGADLPIPGGLAVSIKDLFDVEREATTAGSMRHR